MSRVRGRNLSKYLREKCECCGSDRGLQVHHLIPVACGGPDTYDNLRTLCERCHAILTPSNLLIKFGMRRKNAQYYFYRHFEKMLDDGTWPDFQDVCDYVEENIFPLMGAAGQCPDCEDVDEEDEWE